MFCRKWLWLGKQMKFHKQVETNNTREYPFSIVRLPARESEQGKGANPKPLLHFMQTSFNIDTCQNEMLTDQFCELAHDVAPHENEAFTSGRLHHAITAGVCLYHLHIANRDHVTVGTTRSIINIIFFFFLYRL